MYYTCRRAIRGHADKMVIEETGSPRVEICGSILVCQPFRPSQPVSWVWFGRSPPSSSSSPSRPVQCRTTAGRDGTSWVGRESLPPWTIGTWNHVWKETLKIVRKQPSWYQAIWSGGPSHFWFALGFTCDCVRLVSSSPSVYLDQHLHVAACFHFCFCDSMRVSAFKELSIFLQMQSWRKKRNLHCKKSSCNYVNQVQSYLPLILSFNFEGITSPSWAP